MPKNKTVFEDCDVLVVGGGMAEGARLKKEFNKNVPAYRLLQEQLVDAFQRGYLLGLDGRKLFVRAQHKLLSQLLQSAGAILAKQWLALADQTLRQEKLDSYIVGWIHDELQTCCPTEEEAQYVGSLYERLSVQAGQACGITKIGITSQSQLGRHWGSTH